jgi:hypothetical protein
MNKLRLFPLFPLIVGLMLLAGLAMPSHAFNLLQDIDQQTQWCLGSNVEAGTTVVLRSDASTNTKAGQYVGSALACVSNYRFVNLSGGGTFVPQTDGTLRAIDTVKVGLNLAYVFQNFVNKPPAILNNLIVGPSLLTTVVSTPHVFIPAVDLNYKFGS